jgi:hypothetical protein
MGGKSPLELFHSRVGDLRTAKVEAVELAETLGPPCRPIPSGIPGEDSCASVCGAYRRDAIHCPTPIIPGNRVDRLDIPRLATREGRCQAAWMSIGSAVGRGRNRHRHRPDAREGLTNLDELNVRSTQRLARRAGLKITLHDLRRSFGCRYAAVVPAQVLQRLMRHADIKTTLEFYTDLDNVLDDAIRMSQPLLLPLERLPGSSLPTSDGTGRRATASRAATYCKRPCKPPVGCSVPLPSCEHVG